MLRRAAVEVILDKGLGSFSLREVARRAEVSHAAPGYHFGDMRGLLTSVAIEGFGRLRDETGGASADIADPAERLKAIGRAYVRVAVESPGHCQVIFRDDVIDTDDPELQRVGLEAYAVLETAVRAVLGDGASDQDVTVASRLCWSSVQGLVELRSKFAILDEIAGVEPADIEDMAEMFTTLLLSGLRGPSG